MIALLGVMLLLICQQQVLQKFSCWSELSLSVDICKSRYTVKPESFCNIFITLMTQRFLSLYCERLTAIGTIFLNDNLTLIIISLTGNIEPA